MRRPSLNVFFVLGRLLAAATAVFVSACGPAYGGGTLLYAGDPHEAVVELECLDVRVERVAAPRVILAYRIGNRCLRPVAVDLRAVQLRGAVGLELVDLTVSDPRRELSRGTIDGGGTLEEHISYDAPVDVGRVCLTLEGIAEGASAEPICVEERS